MRTHRSTSPLHSPSVHRSPPSVVRAPPVLTWAPPRPRPRLGIAPPGYTSPPGYRSVVIGATVVSLAALDLPGPPRSPPVPSTPRRRRLPRHPRSAHHRARPPAPSAACGPSSASASRAATTPSTPATATTGPTSSRPATWHGLGLTGLPSQAPPVGPGPGRRRAAGPQRLGPVAGLFPPPRPALAPVGRPRGAGSAVRTCRLHPTCSSSQSKVTWAERRMLSDWQWVEAPSSAVNRTAVTGPGPRPPGRRTGPGLGPLAVADQGQHRAADGRAPAGPGGTGRWRPARRGTTARRTARRWPRSPTASGGASGPRAPR